VTGATDSMARGGCIDVHAHLFPGSYLDRLDAHGVRTAAQRGIGADDTPRDLEQRFALMATAGVATQVLSVAPLTPSLSESVYAADLCKAVNDRYCEIVEQHPGRFAAFATLPLPHVDAALRELDRVVDEPTIVGVALTSSVADLLVTDSAFRSLWEELDHRGVAVFLHPAGCGALSPLVAAHRLTWMVGAPMEDTLVAASLITAGYVSRYPNIRFIHSHLAGALPFLLSRWDGLRTYEAADAPLSPSEAARRMWYDTVTHGSVPALRAAAEVLGADRLLFGSDFPYQRGEHYVHAAVYLDQIGLPDADVDRIRSVSAAEVLGLCEEAQIS
jgi:predicted TIM-barrel fold metal-dependent hydrolase